MLRFSNGASFWVVSIGHDMKRELTDILDRLSRSDNECGHVEVFLFGSTRRGTAPHSDVDLLVVYHDQQEIRLVRNMLDKLDFEFPLDVIYMSAYEERELDFIGTQACLKIYPQ